MYLLTFNLFPHDGQAMIPRNKYVLLTFFNLLSARFFNIICILLKRSLEIIPLCVFLYTLSFHLVSPHNAGFFNSLMIVFGRQFLSVVSVFCIYSAILPLDIPLSYLSIIFSLLLVRFSFGINFSFSPKSNG